MPRLQRQIARNFPNWRPLIIEVLGSLSVYRSVRGPDSTSSGSFFKSWKFED